MGSRVDRLLNKKILQARDHSCLKNKDRYAKGHSQHRYDRLPFSADQMCDNDL
jgi:hypothetical protein